MIRSNFRARSSINGIQLSPYIGNVATGCRKHNIYSGTVKLYNARTPHWTRSSVTRLKLVLANWYANSAGEALPANTATFTASIEYPVGTYTQVKFSTLASGTCAAGSTIESDWVTVSIPANTKFFARVYHSSSAGFCYYQMPTDSGNVDSANGATIEFSNTTLTDKTMSGTIGNSNSVACAYPVAIVSDTTAPTCLLIGDSICEGEDDTYDGTQHALGYLERAIEPYYGFSNMGASGEPASTFISSGSRRAALAQYFSHIICEYGVNDMGAVADGAALVARLNNVYALAPFSGRTFIQTTLSPRSTSTDTWITKANQTVPTDYVVGAKCDAANTLIRAGGVGNADCIDLLAGAFDPADNKWLVDGTANKYTSDGIHPNQFATKAMAALFNRALIKYTNTKWYLDPVYRADGVAPTVIFDFANKRYALNGVPYDFAANFIPSRPSVALYRNSSGILTEAAINEPRYDYDPLTGYSLGLFMEGAATNIARPSRDIGAWTTNSGNTRTNNIADSPYGPATAAHLKETSATTFHYTAPIITATASGTEWVFSGLFKKVTDDIVQLANVNNVNVYANFNLVTGVVTAQGTGATFTRMENWGNGWWLCEMTSVAGASNTPAIVLCNNNPSSAWIPSYAGNVGDGVYVADFQVEVGRESTSRIVTTTAAVTRAADAGYIPVSGFYTASAPVTMMAEYTAMSKYYLAGTAQAQAVLSLWDGTNNNRTGLRLLASTPEPTYVHVVGGTVELASGIGTTCPVRGNCKTAMAIGGSDSRASGGGVLSSAFTLSAVAATANRLSFGVGAGAVPLSGVVKSTRFWNNLRVSNSELQRITS